MHCQAYAPPVFIIAQLVPQEQFVKHVIQQRIGSTTQRLKNVIVKLVIMTLVLKNVRNAHMLALSVLTMQINAQFAIQFKEFSITTGVNVL